MALSDKANDVFVVVTTVVAMRIMRFFFLLPVAVQFYVPFNLLFLVYDLVVAVWLLPGFIAFRSFRHQRIAKRIEDCGWFYVILAVLSAVICVLYWDLVRGAMYRFFRTIIPYL